MQTIDSATNDEAKPQPVDATGVERAVDDAAAPQAQRLQAEEDEKAQTVRLDEMQAQMTAEREPWEQELREYEHSL